MVCSSQAGPGFVPRGKPRPGVYDGLACSQVAFVAHAVPSLCCVKADHTCELAIELWLGAQADQAYAGTGARWI
jgi:hypothetical protein